MQPIGGCTPADVPRANPAPRSWLILWRRDVRDGHVDALLLDERKWFQRPQQPVFEYRFQFTHEASMVTALREDPSWTLPAVSVRPEVAARIAVGQLQMIEAQQRQDVAWKSCRCMRFSAA